jgi:hypothetical protein
VTRVVRGQLWSLMDAMRPRYTLRITRKSGTRAYGTMPDGKERSVELNVLQHGHRGARLIEHPNGKLAGPCKRQVRDSVLPRVAVVETKTASEYVKTQRPKGITPTNGTQREALALLEAGTSVDDLCVKYDKPRSVVVAWLSRAREARRDERNAAACRRTG